MRSIKEMDKRLDEREEEIERLQREKEELQVNGLRQETLFKLEIERLNNIIKEVYEYLDKKKDVPEWWDTDFMICMDILKGGTGNLKDILGSDKE